MRIAIPPEGRWGIDVRYVEGREERHWVRPDTPPDAPELRYPAHAAACDAPTWLVPRIRAAVWDDWPRCTACETAEREHLAPLMTSKEESRRGQAATR